ncbi:MAG: hypothetical protein U0176_05440 [Bacteroidia bacterium]
MKTDLSVDDSGGKKGLELFHHGRSQLNRIIPYIENQKEHHRKRTFREEYLGFLRNFGIEFKEQYLFQWIMDGYGAES